MNWREKNKMKVKRNLMG